MITFYFKHLNGHYLVTAESKKIAVALIHHRYGFKPKESTMVEVDLKKRGIRKL